MEQIGLNNIDSVDSLEEALSRPTDGVLETLRQIPGDIMVLGAAGKMGPTLVRMLRRGLDEIGQNKRRVIAVSRFSSPQTKEKLQQQGIEVISCDLMDHAAVSTLPDAPNVIFMAGQKFGTADAPEQTWAANTIVPAIVGERFSKSRIVAFSTGCVYPLMPLSGPGAREGDPLTPPGEYANSCVGRERVLGYFASRNRTRLLLFRLCYAIDLRYGVLADVARKVAAGLPVDVTMGEVQVIWQGDANARAIQCLAYADSPPMALNVTGQERILVRDLATRFGEKLGHPVIIVGKESNNSWLWDASRSYELFGPPRITLESMINATVKWIQHDGESWNKPTHFEVQDGTF